MQTKEDVLQNCTVEGTVIKLPAGQLDRKLYLDVSNSLQLIGGKWKGGKTFGFVFDSDPTDLLEQIATGEKRNLKKEFQFFATPKELANRLYDKLAFIINTNQKVLEPSAGDGALVKVVVEDNPGVTVDCFELMEINRMKLSKVAGANIIGDDFLLCNIKDTYDFIIANPPFSKNQDIDHIKKMYSVLANGGRMVAISSKHWQISSNKKETDFKQWLEAVDAEIEEIESGEFKESGTSVGGLIIAINK